MKKLFSLLQILALVTSPAFASSSTILKANVYEGGKNVLQNSSFDFPTSAYGWTITTVTGAKETSTIVDGKQSEKLTYSSQTGGISQSITPAVNTSGVNYEATCKVNTTMTTIEVCGLTNGTNANCQAVPASGTWQTVTANFIGPSNGTSVGVKVDTTASGTGTVYVDDCYVGPARNLGAGTFTTPWVAYTPTFTGFGTPTNVAFYSRRVGDSLEVKGAYLPVGATATQAQITIGYGGQNANVTIDPKVGTNELVGVQEQNVAASTYFGQTVLATGGTNYFMFGIKGSSTTALTPQTGAAASNGVLVNFFAKVPIKEFTDQPFYRADSTPASWSGYQNGISGGCSTSSTTYADPSACTGITLNQITARNITCSQNGTGPSISCNLARIGMHTICAGVTARNTVSNADWNFQLVDGSGTIIDPTESATAAANTDSGVKLCGKINITSLASPAIFKVKLATDGGGTINIKNGTASGSSAITWTVDEGDAPSSAIYSTGSVTNGSKTQGFHHNAAQVTAQCGSGACTYTALDTNAVTGISGNNSGGYTVTLAAGECSSLPIWTSSSDNASTGLVCNPVQSGSTTTSLKIQCVTFAGGGANAMFQLSYDCAH